MRTRALLPLLTAALLTAGASQARASAPAIYDVILDGTGSMSEEHFRASCKAVAALADRLYDRALRRPGQLSDWLAVNYFGGPDDFEGTIFINCSDRKSLDKLKEWLLTKQHPKYGKTAIYSAIGHGLLEVMDHDSKLPGYFVKMLIVITDGEDNGSPAPLKQEIKQLFPNTDLHLIVIGVGDGAKAAQEFKDDANHIETLSSFDKLADALVAVTDLVD